MKPTRKHVIDLADRHIVEADYLGQCAQNAYIQVRSLSRRYRQSEAAHRFCAAALRRAAKTLKR